MKRLAVLTNFLPAPPFNGQAIRAFHLARSLTTLGSVALYCRSSPSYVNRYRTREELSLYSQVHIEEIDPTGDRDRLFTFWPDHGASARRLLEDHEREPYDVVVATQLYTLSAALALGGARVILDEHNIESQFYGAWADAEASPTIAAMERDLWPRADLVTCVSEADRACILRHRQGPVVVIPNGTPFGSIPYVPSAARGSKDVLYVGTFLWRPNARAAEFLAQEVMPRVLPSEPTARLVLAGQPSNAVAELRGPNVKVTGTVESVEPWLTQSAVSVNALARGAGSSLKTPEALASGIPLVATALGVRGFPVVAHEHYLPAENADEFAERILSVLSEPARYDAMGLRARQLASFFDWPKIEAQFATAIAQVLALLKS